MSDSEIFQKIITINGSALSDQNKQIIMRCSTMLLEFMFDHSPFPEYFRMRLKDSENNPFAKDVKLEWQVFKKSD